MAINPQETYSCIAESYEKGMLNKPTHVSNGMLSSLQPRAAISQSKLQEQSAGVGSTIT